MTTTNRQNLPQTISKTGIWVIATPIGNLSDFSDRAKELLSQMDRIYCEDTRVSGALMSYFGIRVPCQRLDAHSTEKQLKAAAGFAKQGGRVAYLSDAGTPGVSDPAAGFLKEAYAIGCEVFVVPGPSALSSLVSLSPWGLESVVFRGFFPREKKGIAQEQKLLSHTRTSGLAGLWVYFESPKRMVSTLGVLEKWTSDESFADLEFIFSKELTKIHEKTWVGSLKTLKPVLDTHFKKEGERGEWVFGIYVNSLRKSETNETEKLEWVNILHHLLICGVESRVCLEYLGQTFGVNRKPIYQAILDFKKSKFRG